MSQTEDDVRRVEAFAEKERKHLAELKEQARKRRFAGVMKSRPGTGRLARGRAAYHENEIGPDPTLTDIGIRDRERLKKLGLCPFNKGTRPEMAQRIIRRAAMKMKGKQK